MASKDSKLNTLVKQILGISRKNRTGTLSLTSADGQEKRVVFVQGYVADIDTGREDTALEAALLRTAAFSDRDFRKAKKLQAKKDVTLASALLEMKIVPEETIVESSQQQVLDEMSEVFHWQLDASDFEEHEEHERLDGFLSDLTEFLEIYIDGEEVVLEGLHAADAWELVVENFIMLRDVYYATPSSFQYFREQESYPEEHAIISAVDGIKDVEEVILLSGLNPFVALKLARSLITSNELELINPVQMYQLGVEAAGTGAPEKAIKLFQRAHERGLDDFDLQLKLAQNHEKINNKAMAIEWYRHFAKKCLSQLRIDEAASSLKRALHLDSDNAEIREKYLSLLQQSNRHEKIAEEVVDLADHKASHGDVEGALQLLLQYQEKDKCDVKLQQKIIKFAEASDNSEVAAREREELAKNLDLLKDVESALEVYQKMFCDGDDSVDVRLKLIELHQKSGNHHKALDHIQYVLNLPKDRDVRDVDTLVRLHKTVRELKPIDLRSNQWLADHYVEVGESEQAAKVLTEWISHLKREGEPEDAEHAYQRLVNLDDKPEHRWGLASILETLGRVSEAQRELRSLADLSIRRKEYDQAMRALDYILKQSPFDIETRKTQAALFELKDDKGMAARKCKEVALLDIMSGNTLEAEQYCRQLLVIDPNDAEMVAKLGGLYEESGDRQKAAEQFLKAAKIHLKGLNYGFCKNATERLLAIEPGHPEGQTLLDEVEAKLEASVTPQQVHSQRQVETPATPSQKSPVADPTPVSPALASPLDNDQKEIFQPTPPIMTNVSKSMARLKRLKEEAFKGSSAAMGSGDSTSSDHGATVSVASITAKLRALKGDDAANDEPKPAAATPSSGGSVGTQAEGGGGVTTSTNTTRSAETSSLKSLAGNAETTAAAPTGGNDSLEPTAADTPQEISKDGQERKQLKLGGAASKLAALRGQQQKVEEEDIELESSVH